MANPHATILTDGSFDWSAGVNSSKVTTLASPMNPNGLSRNELAWLVNGTVQDGGITQRTGWSLNGRMADGTTLFQGWYLYEPVDDSAPYLISSIGGHIIRYIPDTGVVTDLSVMFGLFNPATAPADQAFFCQAEEFLIIQAGDGVTLPLFWDGATLRRSNGITGNTSGPNINELPAATCMEYYMNRVWYAQGRQYCAGDIVKGPSGTAPYQLRDSILKVTENPLAIGGDGFSVPNNAGNIRALKAEVNLDAALGQGRLLVFTRKSIYALTVPITRADWTGSDNNNQPLQAVTQMTNGSVNDRSIVMVNGDPMYQSLEPAIRSHITATRYQNMWGNKSISSNVSRLLDLNDRGLMRFSSGIEFGSRMYQLVSPIQTPAGVVHQAMIPLDFDAISNLQATLGETSSGATGYPAWEGHHEGLQMFQLATGDFGGRQRAFASVLSEIDGGIDVWEITDYLRTDVNASGEARVTWGPEFPAFTFGKEFEMKKLVSGELWVDSISGTVELDFFYRTDSDPCYRPWFHTELCAARNCLETPGLPCAYPPAPYREGYKWPITLPAPKVSCDSMGVRPSDIGFQFQLKVAIKGWLRIRGLILYAEPVDRSLYQGLRC